MLTVFILFFLLFYKASSIPLSQKLANKERAVEEFGERIIKIYEQRCFHVGSFDCTYDACQSTLFNTSCNQDAQISGCLCDGMLMSHQKSAVRLPTIIAGGTSKNPTEDGVKDSIIYTSKLDDLFEKNERQDPEMQWQGFGTWNGVMRIYPGRAQSTCGGYDPRKRSWYAAGASGPKDVVIVIDKSGSMGFQGRWDLAVEATKSVLKTLNWMDYVGIVLFDGISGESDKGGRYVHSDTLVSATSENKDLLVEALEEIWPGGYTNFEIAFKYAFEMISKSRNSTNPQKSSRCNSTAILFLSDGEITVGSKGTALVNFANQLNDELFEEEKYGKATLFTFSLGEDADKVEMKRLACSTNPAGMWTHVPDGGDLMGAMSSFYNYYSIGMADGKNRTVWVEPYKFATDGTLGTSVSLPVYSYEHRPPLLLGVAATGVSVESLSAEYEVLLNALIENSKKCPVFNLTKCQMEALRARSMANNEALCYDASVCENSVDFNVYPLPCETTYPTNMWCNTANLHYLERACCCTSYFPDNPGDDVSGSVRSWELVSCVISLFLLFVFL